MTSLNGVLYQSGNIDFPRHLNEWAFARLKDMRGDQEKRIVMNPQVAPVELTRSPELDPADTPWLESIVEIVNASDTVNLQRRESTLRLRKSVCDVNDNLKLVVLVTQESIKEFADQHWRRIAYFYANRHDGFRFDISKMISMKKNEPARKEHMELVTRVVHVPDQHVPGLTFDATGSHAHVNIVEWRSSVPEGDSGRFKLDDTEVQIAVPQARQPMVFLYENRIEFNNHAYLFAGEQLQTQLRRALKRKRTVSE